MKNQDLTRDDYIGWRNHPVTLKILDNMAKIAKDRGEPQVIFTDAGMTALKAAEHEGFKHGLGAFLTSYHSELNAFDGEGHE